MYFHDVIMRGFEYKFKYISVNIRIEVLIFNFDCAHFITHSASSFVALIAKTFIFIVFIEVLYVFNRTEFTLRAFFFAEIEEALDCFILLLFIFVLI